MVDPKKQTLANRAIGFIVSVVAVPAMLALLDVAPSTIAAASFLCCVAVWIWGYSPRRLYAVGAMSAALMFFAGTLFYDPKTASKDYHLNYEVCFGHKIQNTPSGPKVFAVQVWVRLINSNPFPVVTEVTENSLGLGSARSTKQFPRETMLISPDSLPNPIGPTALPVITNDLIYNPPISPRLQTGNLRYVIKFGTDASKLDRTMTIKGRIVHEVMPYGSDIGSFTPDGDSAPSVNPKRCTVISNQEIIYND